jgi:hypothetical protein
MREQGRMGENDRPIRKPMIKPERGGGTTTHINIGKRAVGSEFIVDDLPEVAVGAIAAVSKELSSRSIHSFQEASSPENSLSMNFMSR